MFNPHFRKMLFCIFSSLRLLGAHAPSSPIHKKHNCHIFIIKHFLAALFLFLTVLIRIIALSQVEGSSKAV